MVTVHCLLCTLCMQALKMNHETRRQFTTGSIVNFMAIDCQRMQTVSAQLWVLLSAPVQVLVTPLVDGWVTRWTG